MKKAYELSVLCGSEVTVLIKDKRGQSYIYSSREAFALSPLHSKSSCASSCEVALSTPNNPALTQPPASARAAVSLPSPRPVAPPSQAIRMRRCGPISAAATKSPWSASTTAQCAASVSGAPPAPPPHCPPHRTARRTVVARRRHCTAVSQVA